MWEKESHDTWKYKLIHMTNIREKKSHMTHEKYFQEYNKDILIHIYLTWFVKVDTCKSVLRDYFILVNWDAQNYSNEPKAT